MFKQGLNNKVRGIVLVLSIVGLVLIRAFEDTLFYDPFLVFFKNKKKNSPLPIFETIPLLIGLIFRYSLNTILSLAILYSVFQQKKILWFSTQLYVLVLMVLLLVFFGVVFLLDPPNYMVLFYLRRFLIQPILLLLFVPAFYLQYRSK